MTAGRLVALAALLFVAVPAAAQSVSTAPAAAATPLAEVPEAPPRAPAHRASPTTRTPAPLLAAAEETPTTAYTVKRGDSLWKIAQQQLGDGRRYDEIVALNEDVLHGQPDFITPGTVLRIPDAARNPPTATGTSCSPATRSPRSPRSVWATPRLPRIFEASRETVQPDGERLTDPDLIRPGWRLTIPTDDRQVRELPDEHRQPPAPAARPTY